MLASTRFAEFGHHVGAKAVASIAQQDVLNGSKNHVGHLLCQIAPLRCGSEKTIGTDHHDGIRWHAYIPEKPTKSGPHIGRNAAKEGVQPPHDLADATVST